MKKTRVVVSYDKDSDPELHWIVVVQNDFNSPLSAWSDESSARTIALVLDKQLVAMQEAMQFPWDQIAQVLHDQLTDSIGDVITSSTNRGGSGSTSDAQGTSTPDTEFIQSLRRAAGEALEEYQYRVTKAVAKYTDSRL